MPRERYAGDASLYGTAELRIPIARFALLLPLDTGVYVYGDAGRVYVDSASPGGLPHSAGVGAWIGFLSPASTLNLESGSVGGMSDFRLRLGLSF